MDKLFKEDLEKIADMIPDPDYARILKRMADSMLSDDAIVIEDGYFDREHGVGREG